MATSQARASRCGHMPRFRLAFVLNRRIEEQERECVCACGSPQANHPLVHLRLLEGPVQPCGPHTLSLHIALLKRAMLHPMPHSLCAGGEWFVHVQWWMGVSVPWRCSVLPPSLTPFWPVSTYAPTWSYTTRCACMIGRQYAKRRGIHAPACHRMLPTARLATAAVAVK